MTVQEHASGLQQTKGDRLASGSMFTFVSIIISRLATIVNAIVIIRLLGPNDYGVLSIVMLTMAVAALFANLQTPAALVKFLAAAPVEDPHEANQLIGGGFVLAVISTVIMVAVLVILAPILAFSLYFDPRLHWLILVASISMILNSVSAPFFATFQGFERIKELGFRTALAAILTIPGTLILVFLFALQGAILAGVVSTLVGIAVNIGFLRRIWQNRRLRIQIPRSRLVYYKILGFALPALGGALLVTLVLWFCNTLLALNSSFSDVGLYSAGYGLSSYILFIPAAVGVPLVPMVSRLDRESPDEFPHFIVRTMRIGAFLTLIPTLILVSLPEPFLRLLYGQAFGGAGHVVRLVAPAVFLASISSFVGYGLAGTGQMKSALLLNLIWAVPLTIMSLALIPVWEETGFAIAVLLSYVIHFIAVMAFAKFSWSVDLRELSVIMLIAVVSLPTAALISFYTGWSKPLLSISLLVAVSIAGIRNMSPREIEVVTRLFRKVLTWVRRRN